MIKKAFTLIELLVVVAIVAALCAMVIVALRGSQAKARDAVRKSDLSQIKMALETYYLDKEIYPSLYRGEHNNQNGQDVSTWTNNGLKTILSPYIKNLPKDPINRSTPSGFFYYVYYGIADWHDDIYNGLMDYRHLDGATYTLYARLENKNDPAVALKDPSRRIFASPYYCSGLTDGGSTSCITNGQISDFPYSQFLGTDDSSPWQSEYLKRFFAVGSMNNMANNSGLEYLHILRSQQNRKDTIYPHFSP